MGTKGIEVGALADRLRQAIAESGRSLSQLGREAGIDHSRLSRFVRGERDLTLDAVDRLCRVLGVGFTGPASPPPADKAPLAAGPSPAKGRRKKQP